MAFEILSSDPARWNHGVALCVAEGDARAAGRAAWTPLGRDLAAIRAEDRTSAFFDLGLATRNANICVRATAKAAARLAASPGLSSIARAESEIAACDLDWIFVTALGRLEVRDPSARFLMPRLVESGRTHAVTTPIPAGLTPCGYLFPPNPSRASLDAPFDRTAHERFQATFRRFGAPSLVALKSAAEEALDRGAAPDMVDVPGGRHARTAIRVALRQRRRLAPEQDLSGWFAVYDRPGLGLKSDPA